MLHIHGGSVVLDNLKAAGIAGEFLIWCDVLCQGPTPAGLSPDAWRAARAAFLEESFGPAERATHLEQQVEQDRRLERFREHDEVVLWFGPDFFCQAILLYLLTWFAARDLGATQLSLVCIGHCPNVDDQNGCTPAFLSAEQLRDVFGRRAAVADAQAALARRAWRAFCSPTPTDLEAVVRSDNSPLPFLKDALLRHLQEFPALHNGLSVTEARLLELVRGGERNPVKLYEAYQRTEQRRWITDLMFFNRLRSLARAPAPLVELSGDGGFPYRYAESLRRLEQATVRLTAGGEAVLAGRQDWVALGGVDRWVGGVRLVGDRVWRWDTKRARLVPP